MQDGPIVLQPANFNLGDANINTTAIRKTIHTKILKLGFKQICASIFTQLCPGYSNQPHAKLEHIRQTSIGPNGQPLTPTVVEYYQRMMNAVRSFATQQLYVISICDRFIQGLDKILLPSFCHLYPNHSTVHNLDRSIQQHTLPILKQHRPLRTNATKSKTLPVACLPARGSTLWLPGRLAHTSARMRRHSASTRMAKCASA